jgi:hypothetical protein
MMLHSMGRYKRHRGRSERGQFCAYFVARLGEMKADEECRDDGGREPMLVQDRQRVKKLTFHPMP